MTRTALRTNYHRFLSSLLLLSFVASSLALFALPPRTQAAATVTFRSSATSASATITAPADIQAGDLLVLIDRARQQSVAPTTVVPSGFSIPTGANQTSSGGGVVQRQIISYKIADGSEASASLTGMDGTGTESLEHKILLVFAANATSVTPSIFNGEGTAGDPSSQSVLAGTNGTAPLVVLGGYGSTGAITRTFTPTSDGEVSELTPTASNLYLAYRIDNTSPSDTTVDMPDAGAGNILLSGYIEVTSAPDAPTDLVTTSVSGGVNLSWTAPSSSGLQTYGIWRATSPFSATTSATLIASIATTSTSYSDTSVVLRTAYYYRVTATNASATSTLSNQRVSNANSGRIIRLGGLRLR